MSFFQKDVPLAFQDVEGPRAYWIEFHMSQRCRHSRTAKYETFLKNDLLPRSKGDFRIGAENYRKKLLYDEMVDIPLDRLLEIGYADLRQKPAVVPRDGDEDRSAQNARSRFSQDAEKDHPAPDQTARGFP